MATSEGVGEDEGSAFEIIEIHILMWLNREFCKISVPKSNRDHGN